MESKPNAAPLIVIVGPTASGKSALAMQLAQQFNGEVIAADSRTVYRGMDIGTAKPSKVEQALVPHHLLDIAAPDQPITVADFKEKALVAIDDITRRGKVPFLVGGSGLYVDAVIYDFSFRPQADPHERARLQKMSVAELQKELLDRGLPLPTNAQNPRHLVRVLETNGVAGEQKALRPNTLIIGLDIARDELSKRIKARIELMVQNGLLDEVRHLADAYGWGVPAMQAPGYKALHKYLAGEATLEQAKQLFVYNDLHLAKRQQTWFRRNKSINWISKREQAVDLATTFLNN